MARPVVGKGAILVAFLVSTAFWFLGDWVGRRLFHDWVSAFALAFMASLVAFVVALLLFRIGAVRKKHGLSGLRGQQVSWKTEQGRPPYRGLG